MSIHNGYRIFYEWAEVRSNKCITTKFQTLSEMDKIVFSFITALLL